MKMHALALLSGLGAALIPSTPAAAEYHGVTWVTVPNNYGLNTFRLLAEFSPEPGDRVLSVTGMFSEPTVRAYYGTFYQHDWGGDTAPNQALCGLLPSLCYDTFVTIGREVQPDATELAPGWPGFTDCFLMGPDVQWSVAPDDPQGLPDAQGYVLLGQFSFAGGEGPGRGRFRFRIRMISGGQEVEFEEANCLSIGTPCIAADINGNLNVGIEDFLFLIGEWGAGGSCRADIDADGTVGVNDFLLLLAWWGPTRG
jgi:hypothetical protein